jgi:hypothetical protein
MSTGKVYTPRRLQKSAGPYADQTVTQRNFDLIANGFAFLSSLIDAQFQPLPPVPTPSGQTGYLATYTYGPNSFGNSSGVESIANGAEFVQDFSKFGASIQVELTGWSKSAAGPGTFRIRIGGTGAGVDGIVVATLVQPSATLSKSPQAFGSFPNPGGTQFVKLTIQSFSATNAATIQSMVLSLKG